MSKTSVGRQLRELRLAQGLSLREAARRLGISYSRLRDFEHGVAHGTSRAAIPGRQFLIRAAGLYQVPASSLIAMAGLPGEEATPELPTEVQTHAAEVLDTLGRLPDRDRRLLIEIVRAFRRTASSQD